MWPSTRKITEITEWVFRSCVSIMARLPASRQANVASRLYARVVFGWLCTSLKCCPHNGGRWWQPLIAQVPAGKSKTIPTLHIAVYNTVKLQTKIITYGMRYFKCCPPSSTYFWHHLRNCAFTCIYSSSKTESISLPTLALNSSNVWGFVAYTLFFKCPIDKNRKLPHIRTI